MSFEEPAANYVRGLDLTKLVWFLHFLPLFSCSNIYGNFTETFAVKSTKILL